MKKESLVLNVKKFIRGILFFCLSLGFVFLFDSNEASALGPSEVKKGDILVTNQTQCSVNSTCAKITGHTGIVVYANGGLKVLHIPGKTPGLEKIKIDSVSTFFSKYNNKIKVVRSDSSTVAGKAADKALYYFATKKDGKYVGKSKEYLITAGVTNISKTYCSEIVWYSYYKAGLSYKVYHGSPQLSTFRNPSIIEPYHYTTTGLAKHNGFKIVDNKY